MRIAVLILSLCLLTQPAAAGDGMTVLTVTGATVSANRPASGPEDPGLFAMLNLAFDKGYAFDRAELRGLGRRAITAALPGGDTMVEYAGPRLVDVLKMAQAQGQDVLVMTIDGFAVAIPFSDLEKHGAILAIEIDGEPMGLGGLGPAMIVFQPADDPSIAAELSDKQAWGVFYIAVE